MTKAFFQRKCSVLGATLAILLYFFVLAEIDTVIGSVKNGILLAGCTVLPTLFPFMLLSDLVLSAVSACREDNKKASLFSRFTHLPRAGSIALLLGMLSGFPIGAKITALLYEKGTLDKEQATRLLILSNHTGPAFLFGAVGGLFPDARIPIFLITCECITTLLYACFFATDMQKTELSASEAVPVFPFSFLDSVERAVFSVLKIAGLIVSFRILVDLSSVFIHSRILLLCFSSFFEISNAACLASAVHHAHPSLSLILLAFAVSFGGISVHMQSFLFFKKKKIFALRYLASKFILGVLSAAVMSILLYIFPI